MTIGTQGAYWSRSRHRCLTEAVIKFTTVNGAAPTVISDGSGALRATNKVTRSAEGTWVVHLRDDWKDVHVKGLLMASATDDDSVALEATSTTAGANTVTLRTEAAGVADDVAGGVVHLTLGLNPGDDS